VVDTAPGAATWHKEYAYAFIRMPLGSLFKCATGHPELELEKKSGKRTS
jgi:hypothetical protein